MQGSVSPDARYVAYFDMLGMSHLTLRDPEVAWNAVSGLNQAQHESLRISIELSATSQTIRDRVRAFTFSDSIVMFSLSDGPSDTWAIVVLATELFARSLHYCVPIRGGIAHGRFFFNFDRNLFVGPPLVEAYHLAEEAQWLGIRVDDTVAANAHALPISSPRGRPAIVEWPVPLKSGASPLSHVSDWPETHRANFTKTPPIAVEAFYQAFVGLFGCFANLPLDVRQKYANTVDFVNARLEE